MACRGMYYVEAHRGMYNVEAHTEASRSMQRHVLCRGTQGQTEAHRGMHYVESHRGT